jgi:hypothetical protein
MLADQPAGMIHLMTVAIYAERYESGIMCDGLPRYRRNFINRRNHHPTARQAGTG